MYGERGLTQLVHPDQWARCTHDHTVPLPDGGVGLEWDEPPPPPRWDGERCVPRPEPEAPGCPAGLAHDRWCRTWRSRPLEGSVEAGRRRAAPEASRCPGGLRHPTGVAVDDADRLYVAESGGRAVLVADLWSGRVLRRVPVPGRPLDVVSCGDRVLVLTDRPAAVLVVEGRTGPCPGPALRLPCGHEGFVPARITLLSGRPVVLWLAGTDSLVADLDGEVLLETTGATDLEGTADGLLVVARRPGDSFLRFHQRQDDPDGRLVADEPVRATGYDGGAVTVDPSGRIVHTTATGTRSTEGSTARHARRGTVTTYRLDSGSYRTRWGRVFLEACLPTGTALHVRATTSDEDDLDDPAPGLATAGWLPAVGRGEESWESGVDAPAGRYLWLQVELTGTERTSPRLRAVRVERPGHRLLAALPRSWSSIDEEADFVHGFLTPAEGLLHDLDTAAAERDRLVDPRTTPSELLPWVASFAGLVLDRRWPEQSRRDLVAQGYTLYARRGTIGALETMLHLYLRRRPQVVERWRLRGLGGVVLGLAPDGLAAPTVGGNSRATGMLGHFTLGGGTPSTTSYTGFAHRFTVLVPGCLTEEQRTVVGDIVRRHKPAHTLADVCELGDGLPVGHMRLGMTAYVGPRRGRSAPVLGTTRVGVGDRLGVAVCGATVGGSRVGEVRLG